MNIPMKPRLAKIPSFLYEKLQNSNFWFQISTEIVHFNSTFEFSIKCLIRCDVKIFVIFGENRYFVLRKWDYMNWEVRRMLKLTHKCRGSRVVWGPKRAEIMLSDRRGSGDRRTALLSYKNKRAQVSLTSVRNVRTFFCLIIVK